MNACKKNFLLKMCSTIDFGRQDQEQQLSSNGNDKRLVAQGVEKLYQAVYLTLRPRNKGFCRHIACSEDILSLRSTFLRNAITCPEVHRTHQLEIVVDDPESAAEFIDELHKLNSDDMKNLRWDKKWAELSVLWNCETYIKAFALLISNKLEDLCRLSWVPLSKSKFRENPLALVGCHIQNWHHLPLQHKGMCDGIITEAVSACVYYIRSTTGGSYKVNLGSAPDNCKILMHNIKRCEEDKEIFW